MTPEDVLQSVADPDLSRLAAFLDAGADPNVVHPAVGNTPLYNACFVDRVDVVEYLLSRGADPNRRITYRSPVDGRVEKDVVALMFARSEPVAVALLRAGADPNAKDDAGRTPLSRVVLMGSVEVVRALVAAGADIDARDKQGQSAADIVRGRLQWVSDNLRSLKQPEAQRRIAHLETILDVLGERTK